jgi:hypothetical protein
MNKNNNENNENDSNLRVRQPIRDYEEIFNQNKLSIHPSNNPTQYLKSLATPRFLGSYHLKQGTDPKYNAFNKLLKGDLEIKYSKALRSAIVNPVTIALIIIAIVFNLLWFFVF